MDREAQFRSAVDENKDRIYRICCCYVRDPEERKDVYQEVLIHVWENLRKFEGRSQISTWIYRITVNTCLGFARLEKRRKRLFDDEAQPDPDRTPGPPAGAAPEDGGETIGRLYACINRLPPPGPDPRFPLPRGREHPGDGGGPGNRRGERPGEAAPNQEDP